MIRPLTQTLQDLLTLGEQTVSRPIVRGGWDNFLTLSIEIERADRQAAENIRTTSAALCLAISLREFKNAIPGCKTEALWLVNVGVLLPLVRDELYQAFLNERESRTS